MNSEDEKLLLTHINIYGEKGYPIQKVGRGWSWGGWRSIIGTPVVYRTRKEAVASFEDYVNIIRNS